MSSSLARISEATRALFAARTLSDVVQIRDQAEALRVYMKAISEGLEATNAASEIKLRAERKAGEMLAGMENAKTGPKELGNGVLPNSLEDLGITKMQSSRWQQAASVPEDDFASYVASCTADQREVTQAGLLSIARKCHVSNNSGNSEWYTPHKYACCAGLAMGQIDVDPCSTKEANVVVMARTYYTAEQNGLSYEWNGCVFVNPPYGDGAVAEFASKLLLEIDCGRAKQAVFLVNNCTETKWFQMLLARSQAVCFPCGRISFWSPGNQSKSPLQGQAVLYFGDSALRFKAAFSPCGFTLLIQ